jgi:hypothetical protein
MSPQTQIHRLATAALHCYTIPRMHVTGSTYISLISSTSSTKWPGDSQLAPFLSYRGRRVLLLHAAGRGPSIVALGATTLIASNRQATTQCVHHHTVQASLHNRGALSEFAEQCILAQNASCIHPWIVLEYRPQSWATGRRAAMPTRLRRRGSGRRALHI